LEHHVTVAIVDDHPVVVEGVISWISADPQRRITVTQVVSDITGLPWPRVADVLILDLELSGRMVTDEVAQLAASGYRIVAFSAHVDPALILNVLDAGATPTSVRTRAVSTCSRPYWRPRPTGPA